MSARDCLRGTPDRGAFARLFSKKANAQGSVQVFFFFFGGGGGRLEVGILMEGSRQTTLSVSDKSYLALLLQCPFCGSTISFLFSFNAVYW